jgi:hypothetical protein
VNKNNTNPLKASISLMTIGTGVDNITVESAEVPVGDPIMWVVPDPTAYNLLTNGGVEIGPNRSSFSFPFPPYYLIYATSQYHFSSDFNVEYVITSGTGYDYNAGMDIPNSYGSFTGLSVGNDLLLSVFFAGTKIKSVGSNGFDGGKVRIQRSGSIVSVYINDVLEHSGTLTTTLSPTCTINAGDTRKILYAKILEVPTETYVIWNNTSSGYLVEADGGATTTASRPSGPEYDIVYADSSQWVSGDFAIEWEVSQNATDNSYFAFYDSTTNNMVTTGFNGSSEIRFLQGIVGSYTKPAGDTFLLKVQRIGFSVKFYVNNVEVYSGTQTQENYEQIKVPFFTMRPDVYIVKTTIDLPEAPVTGDYITYNLDGYTTPATKNAFGGVSGGVYTANSDVAVKSSVDAASGDFDYEWKLDWSSATSISNMFVGVTGNDIVNGTSFYPNLTCLYGSSNNPDIATLWHNDVSGAGNVNLTLLNGDNYYRLIRTGSTITHFFNGVQVYSASSTPFTAYPTVRTMGNEACKESYISAVDEINAFNSAYISLPEPGKIVRLQPSINSSRDARFWFSEPLTGDFTFTATVKAGNVGESVVQALFGLNDIIPPATSDYGVKQAGWGFSFDAFGNLNIWDTTTIQQWVKGQSYNIEIKRVSGVISFKVGSTTSTYTLNNTSTLYIAGTLQVGSWEVTNASIMLPVTGDYVIWDLLNGPTTNEVGGLFTNAEAASTWTKLAKSSIGFDGDFTLTYVFDSADDNEIALGVSSNKTDLSSFSGAYAMLNRYNQGFFEYQNSPSSIGGNYPIPASGVQNLIVQRVGSQLTFTLNQTLLVTETVTGTLYPLGRPYLGNIISTYYDITEASAVQSVTWNVAGKTGVGTVTTGANGLITKATGGNSYNVNVLSNETITGDGYVEFINSSIFLNVVFGVAEVNSASGSYDQIIYGTYVAGLGAYERVLAGQATGGSIAASAYGDVIRIQRIGNTFSILKNGSVINTVTINNTNPLKASVSIYPSTSYGVNNVTISE